MNEIKPNVTGYVEPILRLVVATFLVPFILYSEWMVLVPVPFYTLVTIMGGYDPLKALLVKLFHKKTGRVIKSKPTTSFSPKVVDKTTPGVCSNTSDFKVKYNHQ